MPLPYENVRVNIGRADAHDVIQKLIDDDEFRARFETDTHAVLAEVGIDVDPEALPDEVTLPAKEDIEEFLRLLNERIVPETASPFGFALMIFAFGAMPVQIGDR
jgi:putative modified peptide